MSQDSTLGPVPSGLEILFSKDPLSLTLPEINAIVSALREGRSEFRQAELEAKAAGKSRVKVPKTTGGKLDLKSLLDEL